jgi:hypothetical protein
LTCLNGCVPEGDADVKVKGVMAVQQSQLMGPAPPVSWKFSPLPTRIFGLLPDACSSESSDTELEQKQGLQQIEEERKLRQQQQYEDYRSFLEEQKHQFYLQQEAQLYQEQEDYVNGYIQEQCHQNGRFQKCLNGYVEEQHYIQDESVENRGCLKEQEKYNLSGYIQEHETYQLNGHLQQQSQDNQEYQCITDTDQCQNQQDQYQYAAQQYVENELQYLEAGEGCSRPPEQCYSTGVPVGQTELVGQQETDEGGRLFCVVGPTGSACAAMSTLVGGSEGEY